MRCKVARGATPVSLSRFAFEYVLIASHLCSLQIEENTFISSARCKTEPGLVPRPKSLVSRLRCASQVIPIRSHYLRPGNYRAIMVIEGNSITPAHSCEPCLQKLGNSWKPGSKNCNMSRRWGSSKPTPKPWNGEAKKPKRRQEKRKRKKVYP